MFFLLKLVSTDWFSDNNSVKIALLLLQQNLSPQLLCKRWEELVRHCSFCTLINLRVGGKVLSRVSVHLWALFSCFEHCCDHVHNFKGTCIFPFLSHSEFLSKTVCRTHLFCAACKMESCLLSVLYAKHCI